MPKVGGKKSKSYNRRGKANNRRGAKTGFLEQMGSALDSFLQKAMRAFVTYTAVSIAGLMIIVVLMLFAGGYFFNIGTRVANLTKTASISAGFEVARVTVKGAYKTHNQEVLSALYDQENGQPLGRSLLHMDLEKTRQQVEQLGWVKHAAVARLWPNTIHVSIVEREPSAIWQPIGEGDLFLIDSAGAVISEVGGHQYTKLPIILNTDKPIKASGVLAELAKYPKLSSRIAALRQQGNRRWDLVFRNDFVVMLPEENYEEFIGKLSKLDTEDKGLSQNLEYLDARDSKTVYFRPKEKK